VQAGCHGVATDVVTLNEGIQLLYGRGRQLFRTVGRFQPGIVLPPILKIMNDWQMQIHYSSQVIMAQIQ